MEEQFTHKLLLFRQHVFFTYLFWYQRGINRELNRELDTLAASLEKQILPALPHGQRCRLALSTDHDQLLIKREDGADFTLPGTSKIAQAIAKLTVKEILLDSRLEKGQIVEALSVLFAAGSNLQAATSSKPLQFVTNAQELASALVSEEGLHRFCTQLKVDRKSGTFKITYSYCELFYTFSLKLFLKKLGSANHRTLFAMAPRAGIAAFLLLFFHIWFWGSRSTHELLAALFASLVLGATISYLIQTLASVIYDQEHRDLLLQENIREITDLSQFPTNNPNPIIKVSPQGKILFHNQAATTLLKKMGLSEDDLTELLPNNYQQVINEGLGGQLPSIDLEMTRHSRTIRYKISTFTGTKEALLSGTDITRLKRLEQGLRELNQTLEQKVIERTSELQSTQDVTILSLSALAEARDPDTGAHLQRTRTYVKALAERLRHHQKFTPELDNDPKIDLLYRSAPLHDIGKVGIADAILLKPGKLTDEEFEEMKKHPTIGGDALRWAETQLGSNSFLKYAMEIAYYHHEKWDGSGYPFGLTGDDIPIPGRLMALADVYDALISKRVYKEAFSHQKARTIILEGRGSHFDPDIVDAFIASEQEFVGIARRYKEER